MQHILWLILSDLSFGLCLLIFIYTKCLEYMLHTRNNVSSICIKFVQETKRCQSCWHKQQPFYTRNSASSHPIFNCSDAKSLQPQRYVNFGATRRTLPPGEQALVETHNLCPESIQLKQYLYNVLGFKLFKWIIESKLKPCIRDMFYA